MDPSGSELQELRRLLAELTARVFRIEQALNLRLRGRGRSAAAPVRPAAGAEVKPAVAGHPSEAGSNLHPPFRIAPIWNPASVRTG